MSKVQSSSWDMKEHPRDDFVDASFPTEAASRLAAINEVKLLFRHADHLARVEQYRTEYAIKKEQAEQQLSSAIRNQVDETRLGLTILKQGVSNLSDIGLKFTSIDKLCEECEGLIQEWDVIKLVSRARVNMDATLRLVKKFSTIPERAKKLMDVLDDDETLIKDVYKDLRKLVQLRETAYEQSESFAHSFKDQLGSTFDCLQECADALEERVWENIGYCRVLAADDPTLLIRTLEVIEMEDGARRKVFSGIITPKHSSKAKSMRERMFEEMRASIADQFESLMKSFEETVEARKKPKKKSRRRHSSEDDDDEGDDEGESSDYEEQSEEDGAQKESPANAKSKSEHIIYIFDELKDLMEDLQEHREIIQPIFPPDHKIDVFYEREYRQWYKRVIVRHTSDSKELSKAETLKIVNFIQWYEKQLKVWTSYDPSVDRFDGLLEELLIVFIKSTETTIMTMMGNILRMDEESDPITDGDGCFATGGPSDLFITINGQLDIVFDSYGLRGKAVEYIAFMLGDVFTEHQNHQATFLSIVEPGEEEGQILLGPDRLPKDETYLAAIINNCQTCQDYIDEVQDRCIVAVHALDDGDDDDGESQDVEDRIVALLEEAAEGYVTVKLRAVDILVLQVISALEKPMKKLFTPAWFNAEDQEESVIEEILGTLQGYLEEYREWLSKEPPFSRIVKNCLHTLVSEYTQRFIQARPTCDETTFTLLREDREQFVALFTE